MSSSSRQQRRRPKQGTRVQLCSRSFAQPRAGDCQCGPSYRSAPDPRAPREFSGCRGGVRLRLRATRLAARLVSCSQLCPVVTARSSQEGQRLEGGTGPGHGRVKRHISSSARLRLGCDWPNCNFSGRGRWAPASAPAALSR